MRGATPRNGGAKLGKFSQVGKFFCCSGIGVAYF